MPRRSPKQEAPRPLHPTLQQQLLERFPQFIHTPELRPLIDAVDATYVLADTDVQHLRAQLDKVSMRLLDMERTLGQQVSLLETTLNSTCDAILVLDNQEQMVTCNNIFVDMFGLQVDPMRHDTKGYLSARLERSIRNYDEFERMMGFTRKHPDKTSYCLLEFHDGRYIECYSHPRYEDQKRIGRVWSLSDITELKRSEQQALYHSYHDALTGLPNRTLFFERLSHAVNRSAHNQAEMAVLFMDLDGFKYVNDSLGHETGDELLRQATQRLKAALNKEGTLARHGGDEFIILLENLRNSFEATLTADNLKRAMLAPFHIHDQDIHITTSIGIAMFPTDSTEAETLIRKADMAMYHAKNQGRNNYQFFAEELEKLSSHRLRLRNNLKHALANQEFRLLYQPKIDLLTRRIIGCEALIRWHRPDGEIISPLDFIPVAEENGMIIDISEWVIDTACRQMRQWRDGGHDDFSVAVNVSALHFQQGNIVQCVENSIRLAGIEPRHLELEVTESVIMENVVKTTHILQTLRDMGLRSAIDDFGTGYSSLNYLKALPLDHLKIDKSFIDDMVGSERNLALVRTIIDMTHHLGLKVVAEGVETEGMAELLKQHGCDYAQGYYFSRPVDAHRLTELLSADC